MPKFKRLLIFFLMLAEQPAKTQKVLDVMFLILSQKLLIKVNDSVRRLFVVVHFINVDFDFLADCKHVFVS